MKYFNEYFDTSRKLQNNDSQTTFKFYIVFALMLLQSLHFFYQYFAFFITPMNQFQAIIHGNYAGISNIPNELYLFVNGIIFLSIYFFYLMYFPHNKNRILLLIRSVIIDQDATVFKENTYKNTNVCIYMKMFSLNLLNILQGFIHFINIFVVTTQIVSMHHLFEYDSNIYKSVKGIFVIICLELRLLLLDLILYLFAHSHILLACMWIISLKIFAIKLDQLSRPPSQRQLGNISFYLDHFRVEFTKTLLMIHDANEMFSIIMTLFLFVNCPLTFKLSLSLSSYIRRNSYSKSDFCWTSIN